MADNSARTPGSGEIVASDELTYSGDTAKVQLVRLVHVAGSEGAKTLTEIVDATDGLKVNLAANNDVTVTGSVAVTNAGTFATQVDGAALAALQLIDDTVITDDGSFAVGTDKVLMGGFVTVAHGSNPDAAEAANAVAGIVNRHRVQFVIGGHPNIITRSVRIADADGAQTDSAISGTISAGTTVVVTAIAVTVDSATTATGGVGIRMGFGAATIPAVSTSGANGVLLDHPGIAAGSGIVLGNGSGILGVGADGEELRMTCEDPVGGAITITFSYYTIES